MPGSAFEPVRLPDAIWQRPETLAALRARDIGALLHIIRRNAGASQIRLSAAIGFSQGRVSEIMRGARQVTRLDVLERVAAGLDMPDHARIALGIAPTGGPSVDPATTASELAISPDLGLAYPDQLSANVETVTSLWHADREPALIAQAPVEPAAWNDTSLRWLTASDAEQSLERQTGPRIGAADVERFRDTVDYFAALDNRFGGGHARQALISYLRDDGGRLLNGRYTSTVASSLYAAVAEATLLAAWMSYDSAPESGLAQRYFVQALALAQAGHDRLLGASILDAMSHQATFVGRYREAANLARAARTGTQGVATPTLTAHFHVMEARAHARLGDARACDSALSEAVTQFERRTPDEDPEWISYFDDAELSAEFGHCFRDLGRPVDATQYANQCLGTINDTTFLRSDFFATMVLADAHLDAGEAEQACGVALEALKAGEQLRSARGVSYLREFNQRLTRCGDFAEKSRFEDQAREFRLWRIASRPAQ